MWWPFDKSRKSHETKSLVLGLDDSLSQFVKFGMDSAAATPGAAMALYEQSSAVSIPVTWIGDAFASINPVLKKDEKIIRDHPLLELLNNPNPHFTKIAFMENLGKNYLIAGETEVVAIGNVNRPPLQLFPINPSKVNPLQGNNGINQSFLISDLLLQGSYQLQTGNKSARYFDGNLKEIKQIRNYSSRHSSLFRGQSPLLAASAEVRHHIKGNRHNISLLDNGGRISVVFHFEDDLNDDDFAETKRRILQQYSGVFQAGMPIVTAGDKLNIKEMGINNKDMDYAVLHEKAKQAVAQVYKFPLPLLTTDSSTFNNYQLALEALYHNAALPLADCIYGGLQSLLFPRFGLDSSYKLTFDLDDIMALKASRFKELSDRVNLNLESLNEGRELLGREPVTGGDEIRLPVNLVPIGSDPFNNTIDSETAE